MSANFGNGGLGGIGNGPGVLDALYQRAAPFAGQGMMPAPKARVAPAKAAPATPKPGAPKVPAAPKDPAKPVPGAKGKPDGQ